MEDKKKILKKILKKGNDVVSTALSYTPGMGRISAEIRGRKAGNFAKLLKQARQYDDAPKYNNDGSPSDAFKTRSVRDGVVEKYKERLKKGKPGFSMNPFSPY